MNLFFRKISLTLVIIMLFNINVMPVSAVDYHGAEIIAGGTYAMAINSDGDIWAWGSNSFGQLGDGGSGYNTTDPAITINLSDVKKIVAGYETTLVLQNDGDVYGMGDSAYYQLATEEAKVTTPAAIEQLSDVSDVAIGYEHGVALTDGGGIYTWGYNNYGQLGDGTNSERVDPEPIESLDNIESVYANGYNTYAVNADGEVWAWGNNDQLQLGTDLVGNYSNTPVSVSGIDSVVKLVPGYAHVVALKGDGTVWTWGDNTRGQLGDGSQDDKSTPQPVQGLESIIDISAGKEHTMAIDSSGQLYVWGATDLSEGSSGDYENLEPVAVDDMDNIAQISSNEYFNLALDSDGMVWTWGRNQSGELGDGTTIDNDTPQDIDLKLSDYTEVVSNNAPNLSSVNQLSGLSMNESLTINYSDLLDASDATDDDGDALSFRIESVMNGTLKKDGSDVTEGQTILNDGESLVWTPETDTFGESTAFSVRAYDGTELSTQVVDVSIYVSSNYSSDEYNFSIEAGSMSTMAIENTGKVWLWGGNVYGALGIGHTNDVNKPVLSEDLSDIKEISIGAQHVLAVQKDGTVWAWGDNGMGELGLGDSSPIESLIPIQINDFKDVIDVEVGSQYSVALKNDGTVWAWGSNGDGKLGDGTIDKSLAPIQVIGLTDIVAIAAGEYHTLALDNSGYVWAWGLNEKGTLGDDSNTDRYEPMKVSGLTNVIAIDAGEYNSYAIKADNTLWAWGDNSCGQLGNGTNQGDSLVPVQVDAIGDVADIDIDYVHVIARTNDGGLWTWGSNNYGQLGDGTNTSKYTPEQVSGVSNIVRISAGSYHSSAVRGDGTVFTWGNNDDGQLGDGLSYDRYQPVNIDLSLIKILPEGEDNSIYISKNSKYVFKESDIPYSHGDGNKLESILIESIEGNGTFQYEEYPLEVGDEIFLEDIQQDYLDFVTDSDEIGNNYASITYKLYDGSDFSNESYTLTVNVAPFTAIKTLTGATLNEPYTITFEDLLEAIDGEVDGGDVAAFRIEEVSTGTLEKDGITVTQSQTLIEASDSVEWTPGENTKGVVRAFEVIIYDGNEYFNQLISIVVDINRPIDNESSLVDVTVESGYSTAIDSEGQIWTWGENFDGRLGIGEMEDEYILVPTLIEDTSSFNQIEIGDGYTLALKNDGTLWEFGYNSDMLLTEEGEENVYVPSQIDNMNNFIDIALGEGYVMALKFDGTLWAWGRDYHGSIGNGKGQDDSDVYYSPIMITTISDVIEIDATEFTSFALKRDGSLWAWGDNEYYLLGNDSKNYSVNPIRIDELSNVAKIDASNEYVLALKEDGTVWAWGSSNDSLDANAVPTQIDGLSNIVDISAGDNYALAIDENGSLYHWGDTDLNNEDSQSEDQLTPILVESVDPFVKISANDEHCLAVAENGILWTWGENDEGKLGNGTLEGYNVPTPIDLRLFNNPPTSSNNTISMDQDTEHIFTLADFNYNDMDGDVFTSVIITLVDGYGTLMLNGSPLNTTGLVMAADIAAGNFKFVPESGGNGSEYATFEYLVNDGELNSVDEYSMTVDVSKSSGGSGSSGSGGSNNHSNTSQDEKSDDNGVAEEETSVVVETSVDENKRVATVTFNEETLKQQLEDKDDGVIVSLPVDTEADTVIGELSGDLVKEMEDKEAVVELKTEEASYSLPAKEISINALATQIGENVEAKDITIKIEISKSSDETVKIIENTAKAGEFTLVAPPIDFEVKYNYKDKEVKVDKFSGYVERTIALPDGIDPNKVNTGVVLNSDGTFRHVPTKIVMIDGKYYAKINSLTNSTYFVITSEVEFVDVENHWAKEYVNELGARKIISGVDEENFLPDRDITRAEFTTLIVRALGLKTDGTTTDFKDVNDKDWFVGAISAASEYNLVSGYDGNFNPNKAISRQEAMVIITRSMTIANLETDIDEAQVEIVLDGYVDSDLFSEWARKAAAICVDNDIINGYDLSLKPTENITRAETATIIMRLLKTMGLV